MVKESMLVAESRTESGSGAARRLRKQGWLPGIINNEKGEARMIRVNLHDLEQRLRHHTGENLVLDVSVDGGNPAKVLLREVQHDGLTDGLLHADFVEVSMTRKMRVRIPVILRGEPVGATAEGGILEQLLREVEVECLPGDLIESIELDVSELHLGKRLLVSDLTIDPKLTLLTSKEIAIAAVLAPKEEEEVAPAEGEAAATTEPEVIAKGKEEEEGGEEAGEGKPGAKGEAKPGAKAEAKPGAKGEAKAPVKGAAKGGEAKAPGKPEAKPAKGDEGKGAPKGKK